MRSYSSGASPCCATISGVICSVMRRRILARGPGDRGSSGPARRRARRCGATAPRRRPAGLSVGHLAEPGAEVLHRAARGRGAHDGAGRQQLRLRSAGERHPGGRHRIVRSHRDSRPGGHRRRGSPRGSRRPCRSGGRRRRRSPRTSSASALMPSALTVARSSAWSSRSVGTRHVHPQGVDRHEVVGDPQLEHRDLQHRIDVAPPSRAA